MFSTPRFRMNSSSNRQDDYKFNDYINLYAVARYICLQIGDYKYSSRNDDINGWLICDGRSLLRADYPELFEIIGTSFGSVNSDSFSLPDYRGRVPGAIGSGTDLSSRNIGTSLGTENVTLSSLQIPSHSHTGTTDSDGVHNHTASIAESGSHNHTYNDAYFAENQGGGGTRYGTNADTDTDNNFIYRTAEGGYSTTPSDINTSSNGTHTHSISIDNSNSHTHTFTTATTGSGQSHNNMQPTLFGGNVLIFSKFLDINDLELIKLPLTT